MPTRTNKTAHIRIMNWPDGSYRLFCANCGREMFIQPPVSLDMASVMMKQFASEHEHCQPKAEESGHVG